MALRLENDLFQTVSHTLFHAVVFAKEVEQVKGDRLNMYAIGNIFISSCYFYSEIYS